ncbi:MAG: DUF3012 domain-containing protein [Rhodospirillales bacterium]|nr:DUF3012 domain-containing protein [Rhodospirillales bacterium]
MAFLRKLSLSLALGFVAVVGLSACSAEVGSKEWCEEMKKKDKGDWTATQATDFAKHCIL